MVGLLKRFKRFKAASLLLLLALFSQLALGAGGLVKIYPQSVMLGERVTLVLNGDQALRDFDKLDLTELQQQFAIQEVDAGSDQIRLRLYPLSAGLLTIPEIKTGAIHIPRTPITVNPNPEVTIVWQPPKSQAYLGENLVWKATVELKNSANQASFQVRENDGWQTEVQEQAVSEKLNEGEPTPSKTDVLVANYQFLTSDLTANNQTHTIRSPAVMVKNTSNRRWLFFDVPQTLTIQPLPQFLPMNMTVGKVGFTQDTGGFFKVAGDLNYWVWRIEGEGLDAFALQNLAHQLIGQMAHNEQVEWLSESREPNTQLTETGLTSSLIVRLPYRIVQPGLLTLPELTVRYFDVETGKLVNQVVESRFLMALPIWLVWIGQWLILIIGLTFLYGVLWQTKQAWLNWKFRQAVLKAQSTEQLISAMFDWQQQQGSIFKPKQKMARVKSLHEFQMWYEQRYIKSDILNDLIQSLNQTMYAPSPSQQTWMNAQQQAKAWLQTVPLLSLTRFNRR